MTEGGVHIPGLDGDAAGWFETHPPVDKVEVALGRILPGARAAGSHARSAHINVFHEVLMGADEVVVAGEWEDPYNENAARLVVFSSPARMEAVVAEGSLPGLDAAAADALLQGSDNVGAFREVVMAAHAKVVAGEVDGVSHGVPPNMFWLNPTSPYEYYLPPFLLNYFLSLYKRMDAGGVSL